MKARAITACSIILAWVAACGGRVDGASSSGSTSRGDRGGVPTPRPPGGGSGRHPTPAVTAASIGSEIAETYCKAFSSCCVGAGQPPIDVTRCRELTSAQVEARVVATTKLDTADVEVCVSAIKDRIGACGKVDLAWWQLDELALVSPPSVATACSSIFGPQNGAKEAANSCSGDAECGDGASTCAIDVCVKGGAAGDACVVGAVSCWDGLVCDAADAADAGDAGTRKCGPTDDLDAGAACTRDEQCRLGLVCASQQCVPARDRPELYKARQSPYRIGADTCRSFSYL